MILMERSLQTFFVLSSSACIEFPIDTLSEEINTLVTENNAIQDRH